MVEVGSGVTLRRLVLPKLRLWLLGAFLWAFSALQYDMVVTNLFQVPTLCESVYQQVQFGKLRGVPIAVSWALSLACGLGIGLALSYPGLPILKSVRTTTSFVADVGLSKVQRGLISLISWAVLLLLCLVPWLNLFSRMLLQRVMVDGVASHRWNVSECLSSLWHVQDYRAEFGWSVQLGLWATALSLGLASLLIWFANRPMRRLFVFGLLGCMVTTPGPLINLLVGHFLNHSLPNSLTFLADQTLLGPILGLQFRVLPVVFGLLWLARQQYEERYAELHQLENQLPFWMRLNSWMRFSQWHWLIAFWVGFSIAFGDLASYLLVQPPGVTTVAMRMFDLLHYGTKNREAGLAVVLAVLGAISSLVWLWIVPRKR